MDQEDDYDGLFIVSVDELGNTGLWASVKPLLESKCILHNLTLHNKVGRTVSVERLSLQFVPNVDKRLQRLRPFAHSPVVWFRHPYAHLLLVSTADASEYRNVVKPSLRRVIADLERDWGGPPAPGPPPPQPSGMGALLGGGGAPAAVPAGVLGAEWLIVYLRPFELDVADKAAKKVFEKLKDDFGGRGRTRVLRLDLTKGYPSLGMGPHRGCMIHGSAPGFGAGMPPGMGSSAVTGLDELEVCLRECVRSSFDARQAAYMAEVQRLANERRDPNWSFASLYLVKDSLALLLEGCGLHVDAYKEYVELEAAYQETLDRRSPSSGSGPEAGAVDGSGQQGSAGDASDGYGASGEGAEVATLTSASWRTTRRSILKQAAVQEFKFRQYLFASQARLLLRLGRPVDVAERGLRFIGAMAAELARRERLALGGVRPLFKEAWTFTACLAVVSSVASCVYGREPSGGSPPCAAAWSAQGSFAEPAGSPRGRDASGGAATRSARAASSPYGSGQPPSSPAFRRGRSNTAGPAAAGYLDVDDDGSDVASGLGPCDAPVSATRQAAIVTDSAAREGVEQVDWQLWLPFEAEVPSLDPSALCGQAIAPPSLSVCRPSSDDPEASLRHSTFQAYMLALAHLYNTASSALLKLASRAASLVSVPTNGCSGSGAEAHVDGDADEWTSMLCAWRDGLQSLPSQYPRRNIVGMFVDQEEDRQFEATPQQQATPLQLLRQVIFAMAAAGEGGTAFAGQPAQQSPQGAIITPRGEPAAVHSIWLTPQAAGTQQDPSYGSASHHHRSESLYSVATSANAAATGGGAVGSASASGMELYDAPDGALFGRPAVSSAARATGHRSQVSWAAEPEVLNLPGAGGPGVRGRHQHSSSADNASGSVFSKLDSYSRQTSSMLEQPLSSQRSGLHAQSSLRASAVASPRSLENQETSMPSSNSFATCMDAEVPLSSAFPASDSSAAAATTFLPPELSWLRDARLRTALSSPRLCADLALQLTLAAASCFSRAGRQRAAAQLFGDVGAVLLGRGQAEVVAGLMEHVVALAQAEGWHALLGRALPVLMAAQQAIGHVMLPYTCVGYLSLPARVCEPDVRRSVLELMLSSAGCAPARTGSERPRPPPATAVLQLGTEQAIMAALVPGSTSRFYGTSSSDGLPSLVPAARPAAASPTSADAAAGGTGPSSCGQEEEDGGCGPRGAPGSGSAQLLRVGDVCSLQLRLYSNLPDAVSLKDVHLVLGYLQLPQPAPAAHHDLQGRAQQYHSQAAANTRAERSSSFGHSIASLQPQTELQLGPQPGPSHGPLSSALLAQAHRRNMSGGEAGPAGTVATQAPPQGWRLQAGPQGAASQAHALSQAMPGGRQGGADLVASQPFPGWDPRTTQPPAPHSHYPGSASTLAAGSAAGAAQAAFAPNHSPSSVAGASGFGGAGGMPAPNGPPRLASTRGNTEYGAYNAGSSVSMAPAAAASATSYGNLSESSGLGRRAPSWPEALSAAASFAQPHGQGALGPTPSFGPAAAGSAVLDVGHASRSAQELPGGPLSPTSTQGGGAPGWLPGDDLACHHLLDARHIGAPTCGPGRPSATEEAAAADASAAPTTIDPRVVLLQPGLTQLTFRVAPTRPGLYFVRHVAASLGSFDLRISVMPAQQLETEMHALTGGWAALPGRHSAATGASSSGVMGRAGGFAFSGLGLGGTAGGTAAALAALGQVTEGEVRHLEVALQVAPLAPRLRTAPVAVGGTLLAGLPQWLGVLLDPREAGGPDGDAEEGRGAAPSASAPGGVGAHSSGSGGLLHARVHVQARSQASLRIGEWPPPPLHTPAAPLSAMQSLSGAPPGFSPLETADSQTASQAAATAFANPAMAAASGVHMTQSYRRNEAAGTCRVAVVNLGGASAEGAGCTAASGTPVSSTARRTTGGAARCSASAGGAGAGVHGGVCWTSNSSRQGIDLSQALGAPFRSPVLVWLPVWVPPVASCSDDRATLAAPPELVRVQQAHAGVTSSRLPHGGGAVRRANGRAYGPGPGGGRGISVAANGPSCTGAGPRAFASIELEVVVEGSQRGVWRSHASSLAVPLQQPFQVRTTAHQLPDTRVLVSVSMSLNLLLPALVTEVALEPQYGLVLGADPASGQQGHAVLPGLLPLRLAPGGSAAWAFMLTRSEQAVPLPSLQHDDCCVLHISYAVLPRSQGPLGAVEASGAAPWLPAGLRYPLPPIGSLVHGEAGFAEAPPPASPRWCATAGPATPPPPAAGPGLCPNVYSHNGTYEGMMGHEAPSGSCSANANASFSHGFVLEFPASSALTHNLVSVRLLGPHLAVLGRPLHLTWLVTRLSAPPVLAAPSGGGSGGDGVDVAVYEIVEAGEGQGAAVTASTIAAVALAPGTSNGQEGHRQWRQAVGCRGSVHLGRAKGSVAVVEAVVVPLAVGMLQGPTLRLRGLREVRDEEAGAKEYIAVSGA